MECFVVKGRDLRMVSLIGQLCGVISPWRQHSLFNSSCTLQRIWGLEPTVLWFLSYKSNAGKKRSSLMDQNSWSQNACVKERPSESLFMLRGSRAGLHQRYQEGMQTQSPQWPEGHWRSLWAELCSCLAVTINSPGWVVQHQKSVGDSGIKDLCK